MKCILGLLAVAILLIAVRAEELDVVKITPEVPELFAKTGSALNVECSVTSKQKFKLEWEKPSVNGVTIKKRTIVVEDKTTYFDTLTIESVKPEHLGKYTCNFGPSSHSFTLSSPIEEKVTANYSYEEKPETATMSCSIVNGDKATKEITKVEWLKNDTLVSELTDSERFTEIPENHTLVISKPRREDADLYIARFSFKDSSPPYDCAVPYTAAPLVLDFDKSKNLIEDDTMELRCQVKGYPRAVVTWLKNDKALNVSDSQRVKQYSLDGYENARLVIKSVQFEDAGEYTCKAHSDYFNVSVSKSLVVRVKDKLAALWPFLGIVCEVVVLCAIIFIYEKRRNKQAESDANNAQDVDCSMKKEGVRHRGQKK